MEYQKVGRGGAGNFYTPRDVEEASKEKTEARKDVEAQRSAVSGRFEDLKSQGRRVSTASRGGAGNVTTRDVLAAGTHANMDVTPSLQENEPPKLGHYGRGGAGNYKSPEREKRREEEKDRLKAREKAQQKIVKDVQMRLKEPEKAHLGREGLEYDAPN